MILEAMIDAAMDEFKQNLRQQRKELDLERLTPQLAEQVSAGLKTALAAAGVAGLRRFLEGFEVETPTLAINGVEYRRKPASAKRFMTPFGEMILRRNLYQADRGGPVYVPLDRHWGMVGEFATVEVREAVLWASAHVTPAETEQLLGKTAWFPLSATAIKQIVGETGQWMEGQGEALHQAVRAEEKIPSQTQVLVTSLDGVLVRLRQPGSPRGRPPERADRPVQDQTPTCFKQAMVGSVSRYGALTPEETTPPRLQSRYIAQMPQANAPTLKQRFEEEVFQVEQQLPDSVRKVLLMDGALGLWHYVQENPLFADYEPLVDFYHATEHLAKAAEALFGLGTPQARQWYDEYYDKLLHNQQGAFQIIRSIDYYAALKRRTAVQHKAIQTERTFFQRNKARMTYAVFRQQGLPIGSGPVEAACKTLVKTRLGRAGMQWSWAGGQAILQLRTFVKSQRWETFWKYYKKQQANSYSIAA